MANDFPFAEFLSWARTMPADEEYNFCNARGCAVALFGIATGREELVGVGDVDDYDLTLGHAVNPVEGEFTYGALVKRLEAIVQETPAKPSPWLNPQTYIDADVGENVL